jgi:hypothetical protein
MGTLQVIHLLNQWQGMNCGGPLDPTHFETADKLTIGTGKWSGGRFPGRLNVKVHHFTLASKLGTSDRGFTLILDSEGRSAILSRAGGVCPAVAAP